MELMEQISSVKNMMVSASMGRKFDLSWPVFFSSRTENHLSFCF
jgi:hypothetical protein